jgi:PAS domain S-box-containing protein
MSDLFSFFSIAGYSPHGSCLAWNPMLVFMHVFSDLLVALASFSIPASLYYFLRKRRDFAYRRIALLFATFIFACGLTHLFGAVTVWQPVYGIEAVVKLLTGAVSAATAIVLWPLIPTLLTLPSHGQLAATNAALEIEIGERRRAQENLKHAHEIAEAKLNQRTAEMTELNLQLAQRLAQHQEIEKELAQANARFMDLASRTKTGIIHVLADGTIRWANYHYADLAGRETPDDVIGHMTDEWIVEPDAKGLAAYRRAILLGSTETVELRIRRPDGSVVDAEAISAVSHAGNEPIIIAFVRDITQRKDAEREAEQSRAQIARSNEDLERFAAVASHDLNAPLRHLRIVLESVIEDSGGKLEKESVLLLKQGYEATERMSVLIKDLLQFSRIGSIVARGETVALAEAIEAGIENLAHPIAVSGARVEIGSLPTVTGNAGALTHLWQNLLSNAIKYRSERTPEITITAADAGDGCEIAITDNGRGVPPDQAERIFEMHTRLHAYKDIPGSGIGLAACRRIAELHGGRIWLDTAYTGGSRFVVWLPKHPEDAAAPAARTGTKKAPQGEMRG